MRLPPRGGKLGVRTLPGLSCAAGVCSNHGGVVSSVAVLRRCLWSKAESWVLWRSYGFFGEIWRSRNNRGVVLCFRLNHSEIVVIVAVLRRCLCNKASGGYHGGIILLFKL